MSSRKKERIKEIKAMLLEMASGNFFYRLERFAKNDNLEAISISLNMLAEEIEESIHHQGFTNSNSSRVAVVQMSFIIDEHGHIEMAYQKACTLLSVFQNEILGLSFDTFLIEPSQVLWKSTKTNMLLKNASDTSIELKFKTKSNLVIPKIAHISSFLDVTEKKSKLLITVIHHFNLQKKIDKDLKKSVIQFIHKEDNKSNNETDSPPLKTKLRLSFEDIRKIRTGHDLIMTNLKSDFPSLREFALQLGTNEFKLKYGFKELYGTTVHRFLMNERFRNSQMMIQFSDESIKSIAHINGFKSISHFSRAFKKHYGYAPSELRKKTRNKEE